MTRPKDEVVPVMSHTAEPRSARHGRRPGQAGSTATIAARGEAEFARARSMREAAANAAREAMEALRFTGDGTRGLTIERRWTRPGVHPYDEVAWEVRTASIGN